MNKTCSKCKTVYSEPLSEHFQKKSIATDGFQCWCKSCLSAAKKKHYKKNRKTIIAKNTLTYKKRLDLLKAQKQTLENRLTALEVRVVELEKKVNHE